MEVLSLSQADIVAAGVFDAQKVVDSSEKALLDSHNKSVFSYKMSYTIDISTEHKFNNIDTIGQIYTSLKRLGSNTKNLQKGLPRAISTMTLNLKETGEALCFANSTDLSAMRTGAYSAIALKNLGHEGDIEVAYMGSGVMTKAAIRCLETDIGNRKIVQGRVYSKTKKNRESCAREFNEKTSYDLVAVDSAEEACKGADLIVGSTTSLKPMVKERHIKSGAVCVHIGGYEFDSKSIRRAECIWADDWEHVKERNAQRVPNMVTGHQLSESKITGNIAEVMVGEKKGRLTPEGKIHFVPVGLGELDHYLLINLYNEAKKKNLGQYIEL